MNTPILKRSVGTHDGSFHADEVTACALLLLFDLVDRSKIVRTRDLTKLATCEYVCDVGGIYDPDLKRFDHHQVQYQGLLSSAGMVWQYMLDRGIVDEAIYSFFNRSLVSGVDMHDTGRVPQMEGICTFSHIISNFVPAHYDATKSELDTAFFSALDFAYGHLTRFLERYLYIQSCKQKVASAMEKADRYLDFNEPLPWIDSFFELGGEFHPAVYVIMPTGEHWKLRGIPPNTHDRMQVRVPLPERWAGLLDEDLKRVSGIPGAIFCHKARFMSVWETKEDALKALEIALEEI